MRKQLIALALLAGMVGTTPAAMAAELPDGPHLSISGHAKIAATADMATLVIEVSHEDKQASVAKQLVDNTVAKYFDFLHQQGIDDTAIDAANITTQPQYDYSQQGNPKLLGYQAQRHIVVKVAPLDKLNVLLDGALKSGLNEIRSVSFSVADPLHYQQQVRAAAINDAMSQAEQIAKGFGAKLGPVWSINYSNDNSTPSDSPPALKMRTLAASSTQQTYQPTTLYFTDQVDVVFDLYPARASSGR